MLAAVAHLHGAKVNEPVVVHIFVKQLFKRTCDSGDTIDKARQGRNKPEMLFRDSLLLPNALLQSLRTAVDCTHCKPQQESD